MREGNYKYKLGKKAARKGSISFLMDHYVDYSKLPVPPDSFGHYKNVRYSMYGNDKYGCCVLAGAANEHKTWLAETKQKAHFSTRNVLDAYAAITGWNPKIPESDHGTDLQEAASWRRKVGISDIYGKHHTIDSYLALHPGDFNQLKVALYLFGCVGLGLLLHEKAEEEFDKRITWDEGRALPNWGHYVPAVGIDLRGNIVIECWGRIHRMSERYYKEHGDEGALYLDLSRMSKDISPEGFDKQALLQHLQELA